LLKVAIK